MPFMFAYLQLKIGDTLMIYFCYRRNEIENEFLNSEAIVKLLLE